MNASHEAILRKVKAFLQSELGPDLLGLLLCGSAVNGPWFPRSDLDLFVIHRGSWRERRVRLMDGVEVEMFLNPVSAIRRELHDPGNPATTLMFATGEIFHDPEGVIAGLVADARRAQAAGPHRPTPEEILALRYELTDSLKDARDLADTGAESAAHYLATVTLHAAVRAHERLGGAWGAKPKYALRELGRRDPVLGALAGRILGAGRAAERCTLLAEFVDRVLEPAGGQLGEHTSPAPPVPALACDYYGEVPPIDSERLRLRELSEDDLPALHAFHSDPEVVHFLGWGPATEPETRDFLRASLLHRREAPRRRFHLAVTQPPEGRAIGGCGIVLENPANLTARLCCILARESWGKGIGTECCRALLRLGFEKLGLHRVEATCDAENAASKRLIEKLGMRPEGHSIESERHRDRWRDSLHYAILEREWKDR